MLTTHACRCTREEIAAAAQHMQLHLPLSPSGEPRAAPNTVDAVAVMRAALLPPARQVCQDHMGQEDTRPAQLAGHLLLHFWIGACDAGGVVTAAPTLAGTVHGRRAGFVAFSPDTCAEVRKWSNHYYLGHLSRQLGRYALRQKGTAKVTYTRGTCTLFALPHALQGFAGLRAEPLNHCHVNLQPFLTSIMQ